MTPCDTREESCAWDWFQEGMRRYERNEQRRQGSPLSSFWAGPGAKPSRVKTLQKTCEIVRNLVRMVGVPKQCRVELAGRGLRGAAAAGFDDAPDSFLRPYILLDAAPYEACQPEERLDVYAGLGLHESGHILYTRESYRRMAAGMSRQRRIFEGLWEDERIEDKLCCQWVQAAGYLQTVKRQLLEGQELGQALAGWEQLPDLDKVRVLIFAFIRCPYLITGAIGSWQTIAGECLFATLRGMFQAAPVDEADVERGGMLLEQLFERLRQTYADSLAGGSPAESEGTGPAVDDAQERLQRQQLADAQDLAAEAAADLGTDGTQEAIRRLLQQAADAESRGAGAQAQALLEEALRWEEAGDLWAARQGRRFGWPDSERMGRRASTITCPLEEEEEKALGGTEEGGVGGGTDWQWEGQRRTVIEHPLPDVAARDAFAAASRAVSGQVAALRRALALRFAGRRGYETRLSHGRIDPRRLAFATISQRVFRRPLTQSVPGLALALLLDASGSMKHGEPSNAAAALEVAALAAQALAAAPGMELEIYAHTSCGEDQRDCLVQYLYGKENPDRDAIGCYGGWRENYDHQAILTAAGLFVKNTRNPRRIMIVVSDGEPGGRGYGGPQAIEATRLAVEAVRRRGVQVLNVAIGDHDSEAIFGDANVIRFTELGGMVADMRKLLTRLVSAPGWAAMT